MSVLERIIAAKREHVAGLDPNSIAESLHQAPALRPFLSSLKGAPTPAVIAEFKRASPSRGTIRSDADPATIAAAYQAGGAAALSVLTDNPFFGGSLGDLRAARAATALPVLRKDFLIDPLQVAESRAAGADAVLLIVAALSDEQLKELLAAAADHALDALVEVHDESEAERAYVAGASLIGINNRDLRTFETDPETTRRLAPTLSGVSLISESGLDDPTVIAELAGIGVTAFLIGEALMTATEPRKELERLRGAQ